MKKITINIQQKKLNSSCSKKHRI